MPSKPPDDTISREAAKEPLSAAIAKAFESNAGNALDYFDEREMFRRDIEEAVLAVLAALPAVGAEAQPEAARVERPPATDYCGDQIDENEPDDAEIIVWEVTPHPQSSDFDCMVERSWQRFTEIMEQSIAEMIERPAIDDLLHEPLTIKVRVKKIRKDEYEGLVAD